jgi:hypothetical protein
VACVFSASPACSPSMRSAARKRPLNEQRERSAPPVVGVNIVAGGAAPLVQTGFEVLTEAATPPRWRN